MPASCVNASIDSTMMVGGRSCRAERRTGGAGDLRKKPRSPLSSWRAKRGHLVLSDSTARFPRRFAPRNDEFARNDGHGALF